ncbi:MAG TPA: hypothetical protein VJL29_13205, partial [Thermoguttaceae bacterium]|nr:hypothetical protein [Thermoguttaceae bacterium]
MSSSTTTVLSSDFLEFATPASSSFWHKSAPARVRKAYQSGDTEAAWSAWSSYLAKRKKPERIDRLFHSKRSPLLWALPEKSNDKNYLASLAPRLPSLDTCLSTLDSSLDALALAVQLPGLAASLSSDNWWALLRRLASLSIEAAERPVEDFPLIHQLLAGELPLTLAYNLPEIAACRQLAGVARRSLEWGLGLLLDGEGLPQAENLSLLRPLLACWIRCQALARRCKDGSLSHDAVAQIEWAVRQSLRWTRPDGSPVFDAPRAGASCADLFAAALDFDEDEDDHAIAALVLPGRVKSRRGRAGVRALPPVAMLSEWSAAAMLRPDWSHAGPCLSVLYPGRTMLTELSTRREFLWSGRWECEVRLDGTLLVPTGDWEETCWVSDGDVDFLELQIELTEGVRIEREMALTRNDGLLLLADAVIGERPGRIEYHGSLPLAPGVSLDGMPET